MSVCMPSALAARVVANSQSCSAGKSGEIRRSSRSSSTIFKSGELAQLSVPTATLIRAPASPASGVVDG